MSNPLHMWRYWRDKKGTVKAVEEYYPEQMKNPQMAAAVAQVNNGLLLIDTLMQKAEMDAPDDDD